MASIVTTVVRGLSTCAPRACYIGTVREAGGVLAQREKAQEDQYFYNLQKYQLKRLRDDCDKKIKYHRDQIDKHTDAIRREEQKFNGGGGSIREAGGAFAEMQKAKEDQYFYNLQKGQLRQLKEDSKRKIKYHRDEIEKHEQAIKQEEDKYKDRQG